MLNFNFNLDDASGNYDKNNFENEKNPLFEDFESIVLNDNLLLDVRAPIEYVNGSFPNVQNIPLMNDEQRHIVGIKYKCDGAEKAVEFANSELVTPEIKQNRIDGWNKFIKFALDNSKSKPLLYCFRGGMRSKIAQNWILENTGYSIPRLKGGYKAFRRYLMQQLTPEYVNSKPIIIAGYTGSAKTYLIKKFENSIDLENIANHRGSAFGNSIVNQPTQIDFEHKLAYALIKHRAKKYKYMILEDEGKHIGASFMPSELFQFMKSGDYIYVKADVSDRAKHILKEYVIQAQSEYEAKYKDNGILKWYEKVQQNLFKISKRLGLELYKKMSIELENMYKQQEAGANLDIYLPFIESLLINYYDKMYEHQLNNNNKNIIFSGNYDEVEKYISENFNC